MSLPRFANQRPVTILMITIGMVLVGMVALTRLPLELLPNVGFSTVTVYVSIRGGMPPEEVENMVVKPIEEAMGDLSHLKKIESLCEEGSATVEISFEPGTNMDFAALEVREKFNRIKNELPPEIEKPVIARYNYADMPVMIVSVVSSYTPEVIRRIVDDNIKPRVKRINGVANVEVVGGRERKILIEVDLVKLQAQGIPIKKVVGIINLNNLNLLVGDIERLTDKYLIRVSGQFKSLKDIENLGIARSPEGGSIVRLKDIATVRDYYLEPTGFARTNFASAVTLYIQKESTANTIRVTDAIAKELKEVIPKLSQELKLITVFNQGKFIRSSVKTVRVSLIFGGVLAVFILLVFLKNLRATSIVAISIPCCVMITFVFMYLGGLSLNIMTLSGLALGVGMIVDSSVVVLENVFQKREKGMPKKVAAIVGAEEMAKAIIASTITTIVVIVPFLLIANKKTRLLYSSLGFTIVFALLASLFIALTLVPMLCGRIKFYTEGSGASDESPANTENNEGEKFPSLDISTSFSRAKNWYRHLLAFTLRFRFFFLGIALIAFLISGFIFTKRGSELWGGTEEKEFTVFIELPTGAKLEKSDEVVSRIEEMLLGFPEVKMVTSRVKPWSPRINVELTPTWKRRRSTKEIIDILRKQVKGIEEAFIYFKEPERMAVKDVTIDIYGYEYGELKKIAAFISQKMSGIRGLTDVRIRMRAPRPEINVNVDRERAALWGFSIKDIAETLHAQLRGLVPTRYHAKGKEIESIVRLQKEDRDSYEDLTRLTLVDSDGRPIYLKQLAKFSSAYGPSEIWRKDKRRMIQVTATVSGIALGKAVEKVQKVLEPMKFPRNYHYKIAGAYEEMQENQQQLFSVVIITVILIYMVLAAFFESFWQPILIMTTLPLALIGVVIFLVLTGTLKSVSVLIGLIMLAGIAVNSAIIFLAHLNDLLKSGMDRTKAIFTAGQDRLRPILITSLTTIIGLLPMAMDRSEAAGLWSPLALTVIGGLSVSTGLTLLLLPSFYLIFDDSRLKLKAKLTKLLGKILTKKKKIVNIP